MEDQGAQNANFTNANMDGRVSFYKWGHTTLANSTFNNMQIDTAGKYHIAKQDTSFGYCNTFVYRDTTGSNSNQSFAPTSASNPTRSPTPGAGAARC